MHDDPIHLRSPEESDSQRQKVGWWAPGAGVGDGELVFNGLDAAEFWA